MPLRNKNKAKIDRMDGYHLRLQKAMKESNWKQLHLAKAVGLSQPRIHQLLKGHRKPRIPVSQKIAFTLRVPYKWLAYGEGSFSLYDEYPMEEFWSTAQDRICYLLWTKGIKEMEFALRYSSAEMLIHGQRELTIYTAQTMTEKFKCPIGFVLEGWNIHNDVDFYFNEFFRGIQT